jgi:hypothetical protein
MVLAPLPIVPRRGQIPGVLFWEKTFDASSSPPAYPAAIISSALLSAIASALTQCYNRRANTDHRLLVDEKELTAWI